MCLHHYNGFSQARIFSFRIIFWNNLGRNLLRKKAKRLFQGQREWTRPILKLPCKHTSPGDLFKGQILIQKVCSRPASCISNKLPSDISAVAYAPHVSSEGPEDHWQSHLNLVPYTVLLHSSVAEFCKRKQSESSY